MNDNDKTVISSILKEDISDATKLKAIEKHFSTKTSLKQFNINNYVYIQITDAGWDHLRKSVGQEYIDASVDRKGYKLIIDGEVWYKLQAYEVFDILPQSSNTLLYEMVIMFDDKDLIEYNPIIQS